MQSLVRLCDADKALLLATPFKVVNLGDEEREHQGISWWDDLTSAGGEGMVVKPFQFIIKGRRGLVQPAVKCRGREYLRIICGPEYTAPDRCASTYMEAISARCWYLVATSSAPATAQPWIAMRSPMRQVPHARRSPSGRIGHEASPAPWTTKHQLAVKTEPVR